VIGSVAIELYGEEALLRSLAVAPAVRGQGLGQRLVDAGLALGAERGASGSSPRSLRSSSRDSASNPSSGAPCPRHWARAQSCAAPAPNRRSP
jgi:GNAT superfamily N-acetyltransferase